HTMACVDELEKEKKAEKADVNKISTKKETNATKNYSLEYEEGKGDLTMVTRYKDT
ncbi:hypothetical protein NDU88_003520, partial [Pleurodeles waltl]